MKNVSKSNTKIIIGIIAAVVILAVVAGVILMKSSTESVPSTQSNTQSAASQNVVAREGLIEVSIKDGAFVPAEIRIKAGSKITWTNYDNSMYSVTSDSGEKSELNSPILGKDDSYGHVFNEKGVFNYHCAIHMGMKGKVVVE